MYIPKRYGQSKIERCPFCNQQAIYKSGQEIPVCKQHKDAILNDLKCACGSYLELMSGKYGPYFNCIRCGNISWNKAISINEIKDMNPNKTTEEQKKEKTIYNNEPEEWIRSDDPRYFD